MTSLDTLKQAAQALRNTRNPHVLDLVAALEAMAEQKPIGYVLKGREWPNQCYYPESHKPTDIDNWKAVYSAPIATPEHDAQARSAILREAAEIAANHPSKDARAFASSVLNHFSDEHDAQVRNAALEEAAMALDNERAIYPGNSITRVYNRAINDGLEAIRALKATGGAA